MFCSNCGANNVNEADFCVECGARLEKEPPQQPVVEEPVVQQPVAETVPPQAAPDAEDEITVKRIHDNVKICAILWIVIGAFQCISCAFIISGVWNIIMGIRELKFANAIVPGNRAVYDYYDNAMTNLIVGAVINFLFGLLVGCALSAFEFYIRDQVLKNRKAFGA